MYTEAVTMIALSVAFASVCGAVFIVRRVKKQLLEMSDALEDVKMEMETGVSYRKHMNLWLHLLIQSTILSCPTRTGFLPIVKQKKPTGSL